MLVISGTGKLGRKVSFAKWAIEYVKLRAMASSENIEKRFSAISTLSASGYNDMMGWLKGNTNTNTRTHEVTLKISQGDEALLQMARACSIDTLERAREACNDSIRSLEERMTRERDGHAKRALEDIRIVSSWIDVITGLKAILGGGHRVEDAPRPPSYEYTMYENCLQLLANAINIIEYYKTNPNARKMAGAGEYKRYFSSVGDDLNKIEKMRDDRKRWEPLLSKMTEEQMKDIHDWSKENKEELGENDIDDGLAFETINMLYIIMDDARKVHEGQRGTDALVAGPRCTRCSGLIRA